MSRRFGKKRPKKEDPDNGPFTLYSPHTKKRNWYSIYTPQYNPYLNYYQVVSIDPATDNYAFRIERRYNNGKIEPIVFVKMNFTQVSLDKKNNGNDNINETSSDGSNLLCTLYDNITDFLMKYKEIYPYCHYIIIERQPPINHKTVRIGQHTLTILSGLSKDLGLLPIIVEVDPKVKGSQLGAPKNINEKGLKAWGVEKAKEILAYRGDKISLDVIEKYKKKDDLSDTVIQIEALFKLWNILKNISTPLILISPTIKDQEHKDIPKNTSNIKLTLLPAIPQTKIKLV
jgi:hypothetical protein